MTTRVFEDRPAVREATPLFLGAVGPSGSGKTFSALRLATGIQRVVGGDIWGIDTEARRMLHYADKFRFRHLPFGAPFSPTDYLAAVEHCVSKGAKIIVVDSMSHEHEGPGGILEMHNDEVQRLMKAWKTNSEDKVKMTAWQKPKAARRRLINTLLQMPVHFIFCFRAKEKLKIARGVDPEPLGFQPIAGEEFVYEMSAKFLLLPGANGFPTWQSDFRGEQAMVKVPEQFRALLQGQIQLSEDIGQKLAEWAAGAPAKAPADPADILARYAACSDPATLRALEDQRRGIWASCTKEQKAALKDAADACAVRLREAEVSSETQGADAPGQGVSA